MDRLKDTETNNQLFLYNQVKDFIENNFHIKLSFQQKLQLKYMLDKTVQDELYRLYSFNKMID